jgi:hypothetical protein
VSAAQAVVHTPALQRKGEQSVAWAGKHFPVASQTGPSSIVALVHDPVPHDTPAFAAPQMPSAPPPGSWRAAAHA